MTYRMLILMISFIVFTAIYAYCVMDDVTKMLESSIERKRAAACKDKSEGKEEQKKKND